MRPLGVPVQRLILRARTRQFLILRFLINLFNVLFVIFVTTKNGVCFLLFLVAERIENVPEGDIRSGEGVSSDVYIMTRLAFRFTSKSVMHDALAGVLAVQRESYTKRKA